MGGFRWIVVAGACALLPVAGCGDDGGGGGTADAAVTPDAPLGPDARPPDAAVADAALAVDARQPMLGCLGAAIPTTANDPLVITGKAFEPGIPGFTTDTPIDGASIEGFARGDETTALVTASSNASGDFSANLTSGGAPVDAYLRSTAATYWTTYLYPSTPVFSNLSGVTVVMTNDTQTGLLFNVIGVSQEQNLGWISMIVLDCDGQPIEGAVVTSTPAAGNTAYSDNNGVPSLTRTATRADGLAMLFNVPVGTLQLSATVDGMMLRSHSVVVSPISEKKMITTAIVP
jgi:hypothetical protein